MNDPASGVVELLLIIGLVAAATIVGIVSNARRPRDFETVHQRRRYLAHLQAHTPSEPYKLSTVRTGLIDVTPETTNTEPDSPEDLAP